MRVRILVPLIALAVAVQTCCCCTVLGGPQPPYTITPSEEAIRRLEERMNTAGQGPDDSFTITITEEELTSLVVLRMLAQQEEPPPFSDLQVHFRNDRIEFYATVHIADPLALPGLVAFSIAATDGKPVITVEEIAFGPLPIPGPILEMLSDVLNETLSSYIQSDGAEIFITDVQIGDGEMTISGHTRSD